MMRVVYLLVEMLALVGDNDPFQSSMALFILFKFVISPKVTFITC